MQRRLIQCVGGLCADWIRHFAQGTSVGIHGPQGGCKKNQHHDTGDFWLAEVRRLSPKKAATYRSTSLIRNSPPS